MSDEEQSDLAGRSLVKRCQESEPVLISVFFSFLLGCVYAVGEQLSSTDFNCISCEDCFILCDKILIKARKYMYLDLLVLIKKYSLWWKFEQIEGQNYIFLTCHM